MTTRAVGTLETLTRACATSASASFEFTQRDGGATTRCVFAPYEVVRAAERASANATAMRATFDERDANAEIFAQNMVGIDDAGGGGGAGGERERERGLRTREDGERERARGGGGGAGERG